MNNKGHHADCSHLTCSNDADIKKIVKVSIVIGFFMLLELWGHYRTNSLSLLADSLHLLVDVLGFAVSLIALYWAKKKCNSRMTFGYYRVEIIGSLLSIALIWVAVGYLIIESIHKYIHPQEIDGGMFFAIAVVGFFVNCLAVYLLHYDQYSHKLKHKNLNIRAAYVHIIGDLIQSIGVIFAGCITYLYPDKSIVDIICTLSFSICVLISTIFVIRDAIHILAEGTPKDLNLDELKHEILEIENIYKIIEIYAWSISTNRSAVMIKLLADNLLINDYELLLSNIRNKLKEKYDVDIINVEIDTPHTFYGNSGFQVDGTVIDMKNSLLSNS